MSRKKIFVIVILIMLVVSFYVIKVNYNTRGYIGSQINKIEGKTLNNKFAVKIKSGNLCTDYNIDTTLSDINKFGLNTLNVPVVININSVTASDMSIDDYSEKKAIILLKKLKGKSINLILEPYPWIENGSKYENEWLPNNIGNFFNNWRTKVLKPLIDDVAVPYHVDALNVGTSFTKIESEEQSFCEMIEYVRHYYKGLVTYRTSWWITTHWNDAVTKDIQDKLQSEYEKKLNNKLFSKLDFISIATYFELTDKGTNSVYNLVNAIQSTQRYNRKQDVKQEIENFYLKWHKPIFFGELGFPSIDKASVEPWNPYQKDVRADDTEQTNCFAAYRKVFENENWNLGFSIFAIGNKSADNHYYPSDSSAEILKGWDGSQNFSN